MVNKLRMMILLHRFRLYHAQIFPGSPGWQWIKAAGVVIAVANAICDYLKFSAEDAFFKIVGKELDRFLKKVLNFKMYAKVVSRMIKEA